MDGIKVIICENGLQDIQLTGRGRSHPAQQTSSSPLFKQIHGKTNFRCSWCGEASYETCLFFIMGWSSKEAAAVAFGNAGACFWPYTTEDGFTNLKRSPSGLNGQSESRDSTHDTNRSEKAKCSQERSIHEHLQRNNVLMQRCHATWSNAFFFKGMIFFIKKKHVKNMKRNCTHNPKPSKVVSDFNSLLSVGEGISFLAFSKFSMLANNPVQKPLRRAMKHIQSIIHISHWPARFLQEAHKQHWAATVLFPYEIFSNWYLEAYIFRL